MMLIVQFGPAVQLPVMAGKRSLMPQRYHVGAMTIIVKLVFPGYSEHCSISAVGKLLVMTVCFWSFSCQDGHHC